MVRLNCLCWPWALEADALEFDVIVIGAGAAGLMCAITAGGRGLRVCVLDHNSIAGAKILISGGGRCNFTNKGTTGSLNVGLAPDTHPLSGYHAGRGDLHLTGTWSCPANH